MWAAECQPGRRGAGRGLPPPALARACPVGAMAASPAKGGTTARAGAGKMEKRQSMNAANQRGRKMGIKQRRTARAVARPVRALAMAALAMAALILGTAFEGAGQTLTFPSLPVDILDNSGKPVGKAKIYSNYLELLDLRDKPIGTVGVMMVEGQARLLLVGAGGERKIVGYSRDHRVFDPGGKLVGFYRWTPIWSYVYDKQLKKVGRAQCLAYQGVCAAGVAGFLLGLY